MAKHRKSKPGWASKAELVALMGIGGQHFDRALLPHIAPEFRRRRAGGGNAYEYFAPVVIDLRVRALVAAELHDPRTRAAKIRAAQEGVRAGRAALAKLVREFCQAARSDGGTRGQDEKTNPPKQ